MSASIDQLNRLRLTRLRQQKQEYEFLKKIYVNRGKDVTHYDAKILKIDRIIESLEHKDGGTPSRLLFSKQDDLFLWVLFFVVFFAPLWKPVILGLMHTDQWVMHSVMLVNHGKKLLQAAMFSLFFLFAVKGFVWSWSLAKEKEDVPNVALIPFINRQGEQDGTIQFWSLLVVLVLWYYLLGTFHITFH